MYYPRGYEILTIFDEYNPSQPLANVITQKYGGWLEKEDDKSFKRDIYCFDFRSNFLF